MSLGQPIPLISVSTSVHIPAAWSSYPHRSRPRPHHRHRSPQAIKVDPSPLAPPTKPGSHRLSLPAGGFRLQKAVPSSTRTPKMSPRPFGLKPIRNRPSGLPGISTVSSPENARPQRHRSLRHQRRYRARSGTSPSKVSSFSEPAGLNGEAGIPLAKTSSLCFMEPTKTIAGGQRLLGVRHWVRSANFPESANPSDQLR
ncbi:uncharacterized protein BJ171DRAFT_535077 [Polychytrium aggregatum]|uniref:uncharacterized protein n=1 Tax=Polychytrium aggregatum TaxID=110093 RepID=UPI0022FE9C6E|nr:uncharacterized protein BJ171DRAFT_535077 [Polychytrium aggregatum]KAI9193032.1 hypothetical protein BJ171DRAFT_535077 [Polychytrium aggregatum]